MVHTWLPSKTKTLFILRHLKCLKFLLEIQNESETPPKKNKMPFRVCFQMGGGGRFLQLTDNKHRRVFVITSSSVCKGSVEEEREQNIGFSTQKKGNPVSDPTENPCSAPQKTKTKKNNKKKPFNLFETSWRSWLINGTPVNTGSGSLSFTGLNVTVHLLCPL